MSRRTLTQIVTIAATITLLAGCGSALDGPCTIPSGTYEYTYSDAGGTCSPEVVDEVTDISGTTEVPENAACGELSSTETRELDNDCDLEANVTAEGTSEGIEDATATVDLTCPQERNSCSHEFDVTYTAQ